MKIRILLLLLLISTVSASTKLFILGTGTPNTNPERMGSSYLVLANDEPYLFDYGTGVIRRIAAFSPSWGGEYQALEVENLKFDKPTNFFSQKGKWNIQTDNSSFELDYKDTFSVPVGSNISIQIDEKNESLLNCVSKI